MVLLLGYVVKNEVNILGTMILSLAKLILKSLQNAQVVGNMNQKLQVKSRVKNINREVIHRAMIFGATRVSEITWGECVVCKDGQARTLENADI